MDTDKNGKTRIAPIGTNLGNEFVIICAIRVFPSVIIGVYPWSKRLLLFHTLSSDGGVSFYSAAPGEAGEQIGGNDPGELDQQTSYQIVAHNFAHIDAHREIKLIGERSEAESFCELGRQNVQGKKVSAGDVFEGEEDENKCRNLQHPKREHSHGVRDEELEQRRQKRGA